MALVDDIKGGFQLYGKIKGNNEDRKAAERARRQSFDTINSLDWEPMYASDTTPQYQKTQSPVARSYLESFLAGNNPNMTFSGAPNAQVTKANQQRAQDQMFGTMDQRLAQSRAWQESNPYQVQTPTRKVMGDQAAKAVWAGGNPRTNTLGLTPEDQAKLVSMGVLREDQDVPTGQPAVATREKFAQAIKGALAAGDVDALNQLINPKLNRPHSIMRNRQRRKTEDRSRKAIAKYAVDGEEEG